MRVVQNSEIHVVCGYCGTTLGVNVEDVKYDETCLNCKQLVRVPPDRIPRRWFERIGDIEGR